MAVVSRLQLNHPALGTTGGAGLHASVEALYEKIGDNMADRWFAIADFDQAETVDLLHNFNTDISNLRYDLYNFTGGEWVRLTSDTSPARSAFTVIEKVGFEGTTLQITNNTGGDNLTFAVALTFDSASLVDGDVKDVDITTVAPEDGQALVYESSSKKFKPGASGDSSFKLQSVTDPNAVLKGGFIGLDDGTELGTYDGAGSASTDFGGDLTVNLTTILGASPADATAYHIYIDLNSLAAAVTLTDNGRKVKAVQQANLYLTTTTPDNINRARYVHLGFIRTATTGNAWSGTGAKFGTLAYRKHDNGPVAINPKVYSLSQIVGSVGSSGQIAAGHVLDANSFPSALAGASRSWFPLASTPNDGSGNGNNLTANGSLAYTGADIFGAANAAANLDGVDDSFSSTAAFFNPGNGKSFAVGAWFKATDWTPGLTQVVLCQGNITTDRVYIIIVNTDGSIEFRATNSSGAWDAIITVANPAFTNATFHWLSLKYDFSAGKLYGLIDGKIVGSTALANVRSATSADFRVGCSGGGANFFAGAVYGVFFVNNYLLNDDDLRRLYSYRFDHNKNVLAKNQDWKVILSTPCSIPNWQPIVCQASVNSLYTDFSDLASTDTVDLALLDMGMSPAVVPAVPPFDQTYTSNPTFPLTHGQAEVPRLIVMAKDASNDWHTMDAAGLIKADATQIKGSVQTLFDASYTAVRIVALVGNSPTGVKEAESGSPGIVAYANQEKFIEKTAFYTAVKGDKILANSTGGAFTINLPPSPTVGDHVEFYDAQNTWGTNAVTVGRNGSNINGAASDYSLNVSGSKAKAVYAGGSQGWRIYE